MGPGLLSPEGVAGYMASSVLLHGESGRKDRVGGGFSGSNMGVCVCMGGASVIKGRMLEFLSAHVQVQAHSAIDFLCELNSFSLSVKWHGD